MSETKIEQPLTVAELIERLKAADQNAVVMIECEDDFYSGPLTHERIATGEAQLSGPYDYSYTDDFGRKQNKHSDGNWRIDEYDLLMKGEILERRPCLIIRATG